MRLERLGDHWFYKENNQVIGPISCQSLHNLISIGQIRPTQAVWMLRGRDITYVQASVAAELRPEEESHDFQMAWLGGGGAI